MTFTTKLKVAQELTSSVVCVGLDPDPERLPVHFRELPRDEAVKLFCTTIIDATAEVACAYKPNLAFFEALGRGGLGVLADVLAAVPGDRLIIADGKRGDVGNTASRYAEAMFEHLGCDACTVSPYMGRDAVLPFLERPDKAAFALVRTSNASAAEVQDLDVGGIPLYSKMAELLVQWGGEEAGEIGFVVGATHPEILAVIRQKHPSVPLLIPGVGAQGGEVAKVVAASRPHETPVIVNASRSILYAGGGADFADRAYESAKRLRDELNSV